MAGFYEQNPVTLRIDRMRMKWNAKVNNPGIELVRWLIQPDELRMVEAFSKLEATEYALLPDMFLTMEADLTNYNAYEDALTKEFLARFDDEKALKELESGKIKINWDHRLYKNNNNVDFFGMMYDHLCSFDQFKNSMVIYLKPKKFQNIQALTTWIGEKLPKLPPRMRIMVHDYLDGEAYNNLMTGDDRVSLVADLDMSGAIKEILQTNAGSGNPKSKFANCIFQMGQEAGKQNAKGVDEWAGKAMECVRKLKDTSMEISLYLAWGINMQILKEPEQTIQYYEKANQLAQEAVKKNEQLFSSLLIQTVSFKAAAFFQQKKFKEAAAEYTQMAAHANTYRQPNMEMEALWQLGEVNKRMDNTPEMLTAYKHAFTSGSVMDADMLKATRYPVIALNLYELTEHLDYEYADEIDARMHSILGKEWRDIVSRQYVAAPVIEEEEL